jgi:hypothetical protein
MNCKICQHKFNDTLHTPNVLNCGHVYCLNCLNSDQSKCPKCNKLITSKSLIFLDYEDIESNPKIVNNRNDLQKYLKDNNIGSRIVYPPINSQKIYLTDDYNYIISNEYCNKGLWLPSSSKLTDDIINKICDILLDFYK